MNGVFQDAIAKQEGFSSASNNDDDQEKSQALQKK